MTTPNVQIALGQTPLGAKLDLFFASMGQGLNPDRLRRARLHEIIVLEAMSDADLAAIGLHRDEILPHVFGDLLSRPN